SIEIDEGVRIGLSCCRRAAQAFVLVVQNDHEREHQRQDQIKKPEHQERCDDIRLRRVRHRLDESEFEHAQASRRVTDEGDRKRYDKDAEHYGETGIGGRGKREIDDAGSADQLQWTGEQLPRGDMRARIVELVWADSERRKAQKSANDVKA